VHGNVGSELTYLLVENQSSVFEEMLQDLEQESEALGIRSYGISLTTLEEVFMK
jgi:ATP-binding cassette subfamily A (ABC1) protein 3